MKPHTIHQEALNDKEVMLHGRNTKGGRNLMNNQKKREMTKLREKLHAVRPISLEFDLNYEKMTIIR